MVKNYKDEKVKIPKCPMCLGDQYGHGNTEYGLCKCNFNRIPNERVKFIVDLYEVRANIYRPMRLREMPSPHEIHQYNFFNSLIAQLSDKYEVRHEDIENEIRNRAQNKDSEPNPSHNKSI